MNKQANIPISILMSVKNTRQFLPACLDSILDQTFTDWELIAVDDHSDDNSLKILESYAEKDHRISVYSSDGHGIIPAIKKAFAKAEGKYITKMDSDDIMIPEKVEIFYTIMQSNDENTIATGGVDYFASGKELKQGYQYYAEWVNSHLENNSQYRDLYYECPIPSPVWMTSKENIHRIGGISSGMYPEDYDLAFRFYQHNCPVKSTEKIIHRWRDHHGRATRNLKQYEDRTYFEIKIHYFKQIDRDMKRDLLLWGSGSKGKHLAQKLIDQELKFRWTCNNPRKWGKHIYNIEMEKPKTYSPNDVQIITAVSAPKERSILKKKLLKAGFEINDSLFIFC